MIAEMIVIFAAAAFVVVAIVGHALLFAALMSGPHSNA